MFAMGIRVAGGPCAGVISMSPWRKLSAPTKYRVLRRIDDPPQVSSMTVVEHGSWFRVAVAEPTGCDLGEIGSQTALLLDQGWRWRGNCWIVSHVSKIATSLLLHFTQNLPIPNGSSDEGQVEERGTCLLSAEQRGASCTCHSLQWRKCVCVEWLNEVSAS